jgi:hypothetical protein
MWPRRLDWSPAEGGRVGLPSCCPTARLCRSLIPGKIAFKRPRCGLRMRMGPQRGTSPSTVYAPGESHQIVGPRHRLSQHQLNLTDCLEDVRRQFYPKGKNSSGRQCLLILRHLTLSARAGQCATSVDNQIAGQIPLRYGRNRTVCLFLLPRWNVIADQPFAKKGGEQSQGGLQ